ncbi:MAG: hypothetical protein MJB14_09020 [Spirochaetes bacterium]|nr:hypothetical protein [Spirochaetota bacterium]
MFLHCTWSQKKCLITKKEKVLFTKYCLECPYSLICEKQYSQFLNRNIIYDKEKDNNQGFLEKRNKFSDKQLSELDSQKVEKNQVFERGAEILGHFKEWPLSVTDSKLSHPIQKIKTDFDHIDFYYSAFVVRYTPNIKKIISHLINLDLSNPIYAFHLDCVINWIVNNPFTEIQYQSLLPEELKEDFAPLMNLLKKKQHKLFIKKEIYPAEHFKRSQVP